MEWVMKMDNEKQLPKRKHPRLDNYDYSSAGAYFITICTQNRRCMLSRIVGRGLAPAETTAIEYTSLGEIAEKQLFLLADRYLYLTIDQYVIMPSHIHAILILNGEAAGASPRPTNTRRMILPLTVHALWSVLFCIVILTEIDSVAVSGFCGVRWLFYSTYRFSGNKPSGDLGYAAGVVVLIVDLLEYKRHRLSAKLFLGIGYRGQGSVKKFRKSYVVYTNDRNVLWDAIAVL